uniref:Uncharacterized protein n=1 Tax=Rhizophora mucronata TaxID=61149 RepID=A0A2P2NRR3_RHIMU
MKNGEKQYMLIYTNYLLVSTQTTKTASNKCKLLCQEIDQINKRNEIK